MARAIIDAHEITEEDLQETKDETVIFEDEPEDDRTDPHGIKWRLSRAIADWCGVEVYRSRTTGGLRFVGCGSMSRWRCGRSKTSRIRCFSG